MGYDRRKMKEYRTILLNKSSRTTAVENDKTYALKFGAYHVFVSRKESILSDLIDNKYNYLWALQIPIELLEKRDDLSRAVEHIDEVNTYYETEVYQKSNNALEMVHKFLHNED